MSVTIQTLQGKNKGYFVELESLRGLAALLVAFYHIRYWNLFKDISIINSFDYFVDFFFVLSGFVIALNFSNKVKNGDDYTKYIVKRLFRLYPLFFMASLPYIFISLAKTYGGVHGFNTANYFDLSDFLLYITLTYKWGYVSELIYTRPAWSISVEFLLYLIAGGLFMIRTSSRVKAFISLGLVSIALLALINFNGGLDTTGYLAALRGVYSFFLGVILFFLYQKYKLMELNASYILVVLLSGVAVGLFIASRSYPLLSFLIPVVWAGFVSSVVLNKLPQFASKFLKWKPIVHLGTISYSFYLIHVLMIFATERLFKKDNLESNLLLSIAGTVFFITITILAANITYKFIEVPGKNLYKVIHSKSKKILALVTS